MSLKQIKDKIAKKSIYGNWEGILKNAPGNVIDRYCDQVAKEYAEQQAIKFAGMQYNPKASELYNQFQTENKST